MKSFFLCIFVLILATIQTFAATFNLQNKIYPQDKVADIKIECKDKSILENPKNIIVRYISGDGLDSKKDYVNGWGKYQNIPFKIDGDNITFNIQLNGQQIHTFLIFQKEQSKDAKKFKEKLLQKIKVYSLSDDLFRLKPLKGEFHLHSKNSDGKDEPIEVLNTCIEKGYDFMALSDHRNYKSSLDLIESVKEKNLPIAIFPAEEVHLNANTHVHNFGGSESITDWASKNKDEYEKAVKEKAEMLSKIDSLKNMSQSTRTALAQTCVAFDKIRATGGIAVFNHPYWTPNDRTTMDSASLNAIYENDWCDAIEVLNDYDNNFLAFVKLAQIQAKLGKQLNVVGNSDAHSIKNIGRSFTIVFAKSNSFKDIADAIRNGKSVAVENTHKEYIILGDIDLVQYASFLLSDSFGIPKSSQ